MCNLMRLLVTLTRAAMITGAIVVAISINVSGQKTETATATPTPTTPTTISVKVVNTSDQPVPVTGSITISNTPTVNVGNTATNPVLVRDVNNAREPFMRFVELSIEPNETVFSAQFPACPNNPNLCSNAVPPGKLMVIEHISAWANLFVPGQRLLAVVEQVGPGLRYYPVVMYFQTYGDYFVGSNETKLYFWPGETVGARVRRDGVSGGGYVTMTISGYFMNIP